MADRAQTRPVVQRMVTNGDVILVQSAPRAQTQPVENGPRRGEVRGEESPTELLSSTTVDEVANQTEPMMVQSGEPWPYTPAPPGFAYEFGTGRLIPLPGGRD